MTTSKEGIETTENGNPGDALEFLQTLFCGEAMHLVAMRPDGKPVFKTFGVGEFDRAKHWIEANRGDSNMYYHVNPLALAVRDRKAKKEDVVSARFLHVDIDFL